MADTSKITLGQLKTALAQAKNYTDNEIAGVAGISKVEPEELDMPKVFFYGNALPTSKTDVNLTMDYVSNTTKFSSYIKLKCQGTSSMSYAKKNFTINMYSDEARATKLKKDFKGWGAQSKFCLKANYVDTTHTRNLSGARIAYDMVASRPDSPFKQQLLQCPRNGAVDGFPIKLYFNGEFYGIYTWNIPKDSWMFNMDKSNPNHVVLCAEKNTDGNSSLINSCQFRQLWTNGDGNDWSVEVGTYSQNMVDSFNRCINFVMTATDQEFHDNIGEYFDLYSLLDYYCFSYLTCHLDGLAKNMLMVTYDGVHWGASLYDMDSIYGVSWNGANYVATNYQCPEQYQEQFSALWPRIEKCFATELYARYLELRQGALSLSNIIKHVEEIYDVIPDRVFADEKAKWTSLPNVNTNTMTRFRNYMRDRAVYVDAQMKEIGTRVPCTGIVLSADTLSFTTTDTQTLEVVVSPSNTTDSVIWSVDPINIVSVDNGVVTPIANGSCTITATCGSYSDTCTVNVALPTVACTSISLDKTELVLEGRASESSSTYSYELTSNDLAYPTPTYNINDSGEVINGSDSYVTNAIDITNFAYISNMQVNGFGDYFNYINMVFYDADMTFISKVTGEYNKIPFGIVPTNAKYVRFSMFASRAAISDNSLFNIKFNKLVNGKSEIKVNSTGCIESTTGTNTLSDYYAVDGVQTVNLSGANWMSLVCYDENLRPIGKTSEIIGASTYAGTLTTLEGTKYVQVCYFQFESGVDKLILTIGENTLTAVDFTSSDTDGGSISKYQLIATVEPSDTTDVATWSVNPTGIVTVKDGLVTAVANGSATVTATCGTQSATCAVTVSGIEEQPIPNGLLVKLDSSSLTNSSSTWEDLSGNGVNFTLSDGTPDVSDKGLLMTSVKVKGTKPITLNGALTEYCCICVKGNDTSAFCSYNINSTTKYCANTSRGKLKINGYSGNTITTANIMNPNELQKIAVVRSSEGDTQVYINGVLQGTYSRGTFECNGNYDLVLGASSYDNFPNDLGHFTLKELQIFNRALSAEEAIELTSNGGEVSGGDTPGGGDSGKMPT